MRALPPPKEPLCQILLISPPPPVSQTPLLKPKPLASPLSQPALACSILLFLYALNALFPLQSDDLGRGAGGIEAAISVYMGWLGRLGELLAVSFGSHFATTPYFAPLNALIGGYVIYAFFFLLYGRLPRSSLQDSSTIALILLVLMCDIYSSFGGIFIVVFGAFNYLWAYMLIFSFLIPYRILLSRLLARESKRESSGDSMRDSKGDSKAESIGDSRDNAKKPSPLLSRLQGALGGLALLLLGVLAGWSSEFIIVLIAALVALAGYMAYKRERIPAWYLLGIVGLVGGFLIVFLAPGALKRIAVFRELGIPFHSFSEILAMSLREKLEWLRYVYGRANYWTSCGIVFASALYFLECAPSRTRAALYTVLTAVLAFFLRQYMSGLFLLLCVVWLFYASSQAGRRALPQLRTLLLSLLFCYLATFLYKSANIQMGWLPLRTSLPFTLIHIAMTLAFLHYLTQSPNALSRYFPLEKVGRAILAACACFALFVGIASLDMRLKWQAMLSSIYTQKALGHKDIVVDSATFIPYYRGYGDFGNPGENPKNWPNTTYAQYFGVESFRTAPLR